MSRQTFKSLANQFVNSIFADFTHNFTIEQKATTPDGQGGFAVVWTEFAAITGFVKTVSARQAMLDDHIDHENIKEFSYQYIDGLTDDMRIVYEGVNYNIHKTMSVVDVDIWQKIYASRDKAT